MQKSDKRYILMIIFLILGIAMAVQFKSILNAKKLSASSSFDADKLMQQLATVKKETDDLKNAINENLTLKENLVKSYMEQENNYQLADEWDKVKLTAGLSDVKGPGITIKLDDAPAREPGMDVRWLVIHDQDIKIILNELKKAGAQAIAINGERVEPMSEQVCAGPTILINGNRYPVPYVIKAIGDPDILYDNVSKCDRLGEMMDFKIRVDIAKSNDIIIPKFSGTDKLESLISGLEEVNK